MCKFLQRTAKQLLCMPLPPAPCPVLLLLLLLHCHALLSRQIYVPRQLQTATWRNKSQLQEAAPHSSLLALSLCECLAAALLAKLICPSVCLPVCLSIRRLPLSSITKIKIAGKRVWRDSITKSDSHSRKTQKKKYRNVAQIFYSPLFFFVCLFFFFLTAFTLLNVALFPLLLVCLADISVYVCVIFRLVFW